MRFDEKQDSTQLSDLLLVLCATSWMCNNVDQQKHRDEKGRRVSLLTAVAKETESKRERKRERRGKKTFSRVYSSVDEVLWRNFCMIRYNGLWWLKLGWFRGRITTDCLVKQRARAVAKTRSIVLTGPIGWEGLARCRAILYEIRAARDLARQARYIR